VRGCRLHTTQSNKKLRSHTPVLSVGWVDLWVGSGWVEIFQFLVGLVGLGWPLYFYELLLLSAHADTHVRHIISLQSPQSQIPQLGKPARDCNHYLHPCIRQQSRSKQPRLSKVSLCPSVTRRCSVETAGRIKPIIWHGCVCGLSYVVL